MIALPYQIAALALVALYTINRLQEFIMSAAQDAVDAVVAQLTKASEEIKAEIANLEAREPSVDLSALKDAAQALDDIVPDAAPVEDTPSE